MSSISPKQLFLVGLAAPILLGLIIGTAVTALANGGGSRGEAHVRGGKNAKVRLVEFSDFECPFCQRFTPTAKQILADYGNKVSLEYKHFPLSFHPMARPAAEASECAAEQGKFWEFHDIAFANQESLSQTSLSAWAGQIGLNVKKFNDCMASGKYAAKVEAHYQEGVSLGVNGTPATFVNGQLVSGAQPFEAFKAIIDAELAK